MKVILRKAGRLFALPANERSFLFSAMAALPLVVLGVRLFGVRRMMRLCQPAEKRPAAPLALEQLERLGVLVDTAAANSFFEATCLPRSLLLCWLLRRRGIACELRIGARLEDGALDAHAWVECEGRAINNAMPRAGYSTFNLAALDGNNAGA